MQCAYQQCTQAHMQSCNAAAASVASGLLHQHLRKKNNYWYIFTGT
jgi:hypothetical protein